MHIAYWHNRAQRPTGVYGMKRYTLINGRQIAKKKATLYQHSILSFSRRQRCRRRLAVRHFSKDLPQPFQRSEQTLAHCSF
jgi:hypothetical protein